MKKLPYIFSFRRHLITGVITSIWLVIFLILIAPFDASDLSFINRVILLPPYGILFLLTYMIIWPIQTYLYKWKGHWDIGLETIVIILAYCINLFLTFSYYKTSLVNGTFTFNEFTTGIYLPILVILTPPLIILRWYFNQRNKSSNNRTSMKLILRGDNRDDVLHTDVHNIICLTSAQNYVEVHYSHAGLTKKKLLRSTLKKLHAQVPNFVQSHRSHIFNPEHFVKWNSNAEILVGTIELPVSKNYRKKIEELYELIPNT